MRGAIFSSRRAHTRSGVALGKYPRAATWSITSRMCDADPDDVGRQVVHLEEQLVEQHDAVVAVGRAQAVRHVVDRLVEALELDAQVVFPALALGDVLDHHDPAAAGERTIVQS